MPLSPSSFPFINLIGRHVSSRFHPATSQVFALPGLPVVAMLFGLVGALAVPSAHAGTIEGIN
ncbi:hypothetical protein, partial [Pseudomonas yamanorum]|uniref:hypothetical protein n=1 Tax=Pseudomonas yamanorum TaxID=515393 RepID=UPI001C43082E